MKEFKEIFYIVLAVAVGLLLLHWLGQAIAFEQHRYDTNRQICIKQTNNPLYCNREW